MAFVTSGRAFTKDRYYSRCLVLKDYLHPHSQKDKLGLAAVISQPWREPTR